MNTLRRIVLFILFAAGSAFAQSNSIDSTFHSIESLYESGSYVNAEVEARRLVEVADISDSVRVVAEKWIAFSLVAQGKSPLAGDHFALLPFKLNPRFELDPILTSPKILAVFNETKAHLTLHEKLEADSVAVLPLRQTMEISFRTIVFPGWEQLHTNRTAAGYLFLGGGVATLGAGIAFGASEVRHAANISQQQLRRRSKRNIRLTTNTTKQRHMPFRLLPLSISPQKLTSFGHANPASLSFEPSGPSNRSNDFFP